MTTNEAPPYADGDWHTFEPSNLDDLELILRGLDGGGVPAFESDSRVVEGLDLSVNETAHQQQVGSDLLDMFLQESSLFDDGTSGTGKISGDGEETAVLSTDLSADVPLDAGLTFSEIPPAFNFDMLFPLTEPSSAQSTSQSEVVSLNGSQPVELERPKSSGPTTKLKKQLNGLESAVMDKRTRHFGREEDRDEGEDSDRYKRDRRRRFQSEDKQLYDNNINNNNIINKEPTAARSGPGLQSHAQSTSMENLADELKGIEVQENPAKTCKCQFCGKAFARKYTLIQHMRIHTNERTHKCPVEGCGKQFVQKANLSQHLRYHTGERPYVCDEPLCFAAYFQLANLKSHLKAKHGRDLPKKCRIRGCGLGFLTAQELSEHLRVDHGRAQSQSSSTKSSTSSFTNLNL